MISLSLDTSTARGEVAVLNGGRVLSCRSWERDRSHSESVTGQIEAALSEAGIEAKQLQAIGVGRGPGSFTGIRVAINAAKSFSFALGIPIYAFDTCEIVASGARRTDLPILTMFNAQKNQVFVSVFSAPNGASPQRLIPVQAWSLDRLSAEITTPHLCLGDAYHDYESLLEPSILPLLVRDQTENDYPSAVVIGRMASREFVNATSLGWKELQALYIRASGAEEKIREDRGS
jgi:tRNA threonylcarbamoyladenosine biosynthesis protein TsaB